MPFKGRPQIIADKFAKLLACPNAGRKLLIGHYFVLDVDLVNRDPLFLVRLHELYEI
ncbi:hypothetical protein D1872_329850 [compost metagenome]